MILLLPKTLARYKPGFSVPAANAMTTSLKRCWLDSNHSVESGWGREGKIIWCQIWPDGPPKDFLLCLDKWASRELSMTFPSSSERNSERACVGKIRFQLRFAKINKKKTVDWLLWDIGWQMYQLTRVTRLGEFTPLGLLFTLDSFYFKIKNTAKMFGLLFSRKLCVNFDHIHILEVGHTLDDYRLPEAWDRIPSGFCSYTCND
jgi:hypothetical protein